MKVLIVGCNGFSGFWLSKHLINHNYIVSGIDIHSSCKIDINGVYFESDLSDTDQIKGILEKLEPDLIFFFAGIFSTKVFSELLKVNLLALSNFIDSLIASEIETKFLFTSSGAVYGKVKSTSIPVPETHSLNPESNYGISKYFAEVLIERKLTRAKHIIPIIVRPSNLIGPGLSETLLPGKLVKSIKLWTSKQISSIELYKLSGMRDYIDVRDAVRIYEQILRRINKFDIINISTGNLTSIHDLVKMTKSITNLEFEIDVEVEISDDADIHSQDPSKLKNYLGKDFILDYTIERSLHDMLKNEDLI